MTKQKVIFEGFLRKNGEKFNHTFFFESVTGQLFGLRQA